MKKYHIIAAMGLAGVMLGGCADNDIDVFTVEKPQSVADYEYLDSYGDLKSYVDRSAHPNFLLGTAISAADYNKKGLVFLLTNSNFDIVTLGNAMKYASCVADNGDMDFGTVSTFIDNARTAGIQVYGHTLCWHEQQNVKWLNKLIADKEIPIDPDASNEVEDAMRTYTGLTEFPFYVMGYKPEIIDGILTVPEYPGSWYQFFVMDGLSFEEGREYKVTARIKGSKAGSVNVQLGNWGALQEKKLDFTEEWTEASCTMNPQTVTTGFCVFQPGTYDGKLEIEWVKISHVEAQSVKYYESLITNGDADAGESENVISREPGAADIQAAVVDDALGTGKVFVSRIGGSPANAWDSQFFIKFNSPLQEGDKIRVSFRYRCDDTRSIDTQAHGAPGSYHYWSCIGTLNATPQWQDHSWMGTVSADFAGSDGFQSIAFNLSSVADAGNFYIDDIVAEIERSGNTIPLTPEEKAQVLEDEMARWIKGMMEATQGYVKAWDVVNEPLSGGPWGQRYDLQHAATTSDPSNKFFWQDYLGDDYVRVPIKYARQYFAENGGNPDELKLFINDYNLESDWDDNQKLKSLIQWIEQWESDGVTKIDGIGSQMHISYYMNPETQKSKEEHVVKMLELMAATGKLVRITEFDMGLVDENGNDVPTEQVTLEQHKLMSDYYKFIIRKYLEIVPVEQQFGITMWCQTDSPEGSGWRPNSPVGIWDSNFNRKPAYAGVAEGLSGQE